jgi:hypothetical protein
VVDLAARAGVRRVTVLSSGSVTAGFDTDYQLPVEQAVEASGLEWTHLRPGEFAANRLALWGPSIRAERVVRWPFPDKAGDPVGARAGRGHRGHHRRRRPARGGEPPRGAPAAQGAGRLGRRQRPVPAGLRGLLGRRGVPEIAADELVPLPTVEQVTGRPARSFARWALDHAGDFR